MIRRVAPALLYLTSFVLIGFAVFGSHGVVNLRSLNRDAESFHRKADSLSRDVDRTQAELDEIQRNPAALEQRARGELGLSKGDEITYVQKNSLKKGPS